MNLKYLLSATDVLSLLTPAPLLVERRGRRVGIFPVFPMSSRKHTSLGFKAPMGEFCFGEFSPVAKISAPYRVMLLPDDAEAWVFIVAVIVEAHQALRQRHSVQAPGRRSVENRPHRPRGLARRQAG